ncbi:hypothetical protein PHMEG_00024098, partial [Phytophthora megakarya]
RAREGYNIGLDAVDRLSREVERRDQTLRELRDENEGLRAHASRATEWKTQYDNLCRTTADEAAAYQDNQARAETRISNLNFRIAALTSSPSTAPAPPNPVASPPLASEAGTHTDVASASPNSSSAATSQTDLSGNEVDSALAANIRHRDQRDSMVSELCDARNAVARSRRELDVARVANVPLQDNLRRVNALLVAHAEEHQRDLRDLEASSSAAETTRVTAQTARDDAQALLLPAMRSGLVSLENALSRRRRTARVEIARLERLIDDPDRVYTERTLTWRRLLREARIGREAARQVRDALVGRLRDMVLAGGGSLDVTALLSFVRSIFGGIGSSSESSGLYDFLGFEFYSFRVLGWASGNAFRPRAVCWWPRVASVRLFCGSGSAFPVRWVIRVAFSCIRPGRTHSL